MTLSATSIQHFSELCDPPQTLLNPSHVSSALSHPLSPAYLPNDPANSLSNPDKNTLLISYSCLASAWKLLDLVILGEID